MHTPRGLTLIELLVSLAVFAILVAIAAPNLSNFMTGNKATAEINSLTGAFTLAHDEAIYRNASVDVIANAGGWQNGWVVQLAAPPNTVLSQAGAMPTTLRILAGITTATFTSAGRTNNDITIRFCDRTPSTVATPGLVLSILRTGRISLIPNVAGTCPIFP